MKKAMVYILALTLAFSTLLAGCGEMGGTNRDKNAPAKTPQATILPETMMPDPADGEVRDSDGIITDNDSGSKDGQTSPASSGGSKSETGKEKLTPGNSANTNK